MSSALKPCHCGYQGALAGTQHQGVFLSLSCPECQRTVEAFTLEGLAENWNKPATNQDEREAALPAEASHD